MVKILKSTKFIVNPMDKDVDKILRPYPGSLFDVDVNDMFEYTVFDYYNNIRNRSFTNEIMAQEYYDLIWNNKIIFPDDDGGNPDDTTDLHMTFDPSDGSIQVRDIGGSVLQMNFTISCDSGFEYITFNSDMNSIIYNLYASVSNPYGNTTNQEKFTDAGLSVVYALVDDKHTFTFTAQNDFIQSIQNNNYGAELKFIAISSNAGDMDSLTVNVSLNIP